MAFPLAQLRLRNIFGAPPMQQQQGMPQPAQPPPNPTPQDTGMLTDNGDMAQRLMQQYSPSTVDQSGLRSTIAQQPNRADFQPSIWRRLGASMAGMGSRTPFDTARGIVNRPFDEATQDWKNKLGPQEALARDEQATNRMGLGALSTEARVTSAEERTRSTAQTAKDKLAEQAREADNKLQVANRRADIYAEMAHDRNAKLVTQTDGSQKLVKSDGSTIDVDSKVFTPKDIENFRVSGRLQEIGAQGAIQSGLLTQRGQQSLEQIRARIEGAKTLQEAQNAFKELMSQQSKEVSSTVTDSSGKVIGSKDTITSPFDRPVITPRNNAPLRRLIPSANPPKQLTGKMKVKRLSDGQTGTIDAKDFDASKYQQVQ